MNLDEEYFSMRRAELMEELESDLKRGNGPQQQYSAMREMRLYANYCLIAFGLGFLVGIIIAGAK